MSRYSGGQDNEFWLEAWNGNPYLVERMGRPPISVEHLLVGVVGGLQPDKLSKSFIADMDGMYARILFCWPPEPNYQPLTDDVTECEPEVINALSRLVNLPCGEEFTPKMVPLSSEARARFEQLLQLCIGPRTNSTAVSVNGLRRSRPTFFAFPARCVF